MDQLNELAARRQAQERLSNMALLSANNPTDSRIELIISNDDEAGRLGAFLQQHSYLQEISLTLLDVTDPTKTKTASLIEYVRQRRHLTTLSLTTASLLDRNGSSTFERREDVVDAFLRAAIANPTVTSVSLNCCRYRSGRLAELLLRRPGLRSLHLANCRCLDDLSQRDKKYEFLQALGRSMGLESFYMRRSFAPASFEKDVLWQLMRLPSLRELGLSIENIETAATLRVLVEFYFQRPMKFALLGSDLSEDAANLVTEGFGSRAIDFLIELKGCRWASANVREIFLENLMLSPRLMNLSIDEHCGIEVFRILYLQETVDLRLRLSHSAAGRIEYPSATSGEVQGTHGL